jgi:hypothetical protein
MVRFVPLLMIATAAMPAAAARPSPASVTTTPSARAIFERDWVLMNWALKFYDKDHDVLLSPGEAQGAANAFRAMADANRDGRVTRDEYRAARAQILAAY